MLARQAGFGQKRKFLKVRGLQASQHVMLVSMVSFALKYIGGVSNERTRNWSDDHCSFYCLCRL